MKIRNRYLMLLWILLLALALFSTGSAQTTPEDIMDDIKPYNGSIGPGSVFYGIKISIENLGEALTFDEKGKLEKQVEHAEVRLAEMKAELEKENFDEANKTLERFREKINSTDDRITGIDGSEPGLLNAQKRIIKHQLVLQQLLLSMPGNIGLEQALNNSRQLEEKFELRTKVRLEREPGDDRLRIRVQEVGLEETQIETEIHDNSTQVNVKVKFISNSTDPDEIKSEILRKIKLGKDDITRLITTGGQIEVSPTATGTAVVMASPGATVTSGAMVTPGITVTPVVTGTAAVTGTPGIEDREEERLKIKIESGRSVSEVEVELRFILNTVNTNEIIEGIAQKLAAIKIEDMQRVELEVRERREDRRDDSLGRDDETGDDRGGRINETGDDRGGRNGEIGDDRGARISETGDDRSGGSSGGGGSGGESGK